MIRVMRYADAVGGNNARTKDYDHCEERNDG